MAEETRDVWGKQIEFILTMIGYAVGLGNIWRFPYLCFKNGGGAFLIPYIVCLILLGIPMFALECAFGQYGGKGPLSIWSINPLFKGLGAAMVATSACIFIYYDIIIAIGLRYFVASMTSDLPWLDCNSCQCILYGKKNDTSDTDLWNLLTNNSLSQNCSNIVGFHQTIREAVKEAKSPSEIYFYEDILKDSKTIEEIGSIRWELLLCNFVAYIIIFLVLIKGISSLGKVVYFTATFPYLILTILLIRVAMLDGAQTGVEFYLKPDWSKLADGNVWSDAATQIFFSLSACMGGLIAMSSYNKFDNNIIRDAFTVPIINCLTSFYSGFVVFCTLGYMAELKGVPVGEVTAEGPGLVFVTYPEAIGAMPVSPLWAVLFFFMLCILGFSTQFSAAETIMTSIIDEFPQVFHSKWRKIGMRLSVVLAAFVLGIPMCTEGGQHLLEIVDTAALGFPMLLIGLFEYIVVIHLYGSNNFINDVTTMVGHTPFMKYFKYTWVYIAPFLLVVVIIFKAYNMKDFYPAWAGLLYYLIVVFIIMWIPLSFLFFGRHKLGEAMAPTEYWIKRKNLATKPTDVDAEMKAGNSYYMGDKNGEDNSAYVTENENKTKF